MFKGIMQATTDVNMVQNLLGTHRIIAIGEPNEEFVRNTNAIIGSVLLPPYPAMMALMDNNIQVFNSLYMNHLSTPECLSFIAVLLKAMMNGSNLLLYLTQDEYKMYFNSLQMFFNSMGISIGCDNNNYQFTYNEQFSYYIYSLLYINELITIQELFILYPQGMQFTDEVVMKLINEMRPVLQDTSFESYRAYFYSYKESVKQNNMYTPNLFSRKL